MFGKNIQLKAPYKLSPWRKVAIGTWRTVGDPSVYGVLEVEASKALAYIERVQKETGQRVTFTHFIGKVVATVLERHPGINAILRFGRIYPRKSVDVFFQVASDPNGKDLSGVTLRHLNQKSIPQIAAEMDQRIDLVRNHGDPDFKKSKSTMNFIPGFLLHFAVNSIGFVMYGLNLWSKLLGSPKDPFGSAMVTNIGSLGMDQGFAPLVPYSRVPLLVAVGAVSDVPRVRNGRIEIAKVCKLCVTFDHRLIDGIHAANMTKTVHKIFENPELELDGKTLESPFQAPGPRSPLENSARAHFH